MTQNTGETPLHEIADQFINLANELAKTEGTSTVGTAIRYAAARYNTFEVSLSSADLNADKGKLIDMLCDDFRKMLETHMADYASRSQ
jgi:hypothetical protein